VRGLLVRDGAPAARAVVDNRRMRPLHILTLLPAVTGCKRISSEEAALVLSGTWEVCRDVQQESLDLVFDAVEGKSLVLTSEDDGYSVVGTVAGGEGWQGAADVSGTATYANGTYSLDLSVVLVDVYVGAPDVWLDGTMDLGLTWEEEVGGTTGAYSLAYDVVGVIDVDGSAKGQADLNYQVLLDHDGISSTFAVSGDIDGHVLTGFSETD
jgi:hypothetical protein